MATGTEGGGAAARARLNADMVLVAAGDRAALRRVYDATAARLFGICLALTGDREAAEDALQETFVKVWRRAARFDATRASAITWISLIARGNAIDTRRASSRTLRDQDAVLAHETADSEGLPVDEAVLNDCLDRLDAVQGTVIRSAYYGGYSYDELARQAEVPLPTMKSRIRRGLLALRRCLDGE
ncbi:sigma-70 family RNA polymerase sigma factor [Sphingomonas sp. RS2018]